MHTLKKSKCISIGISLVFTFLLLTGLQAQQVNVSAKLDSLIMPIGQQQTLHIEASQPKALRLQFPEFKDTIITNIEIVESIPADTLVNGDRITISKDYIITSFDSGFYYFEPFEILVDSQFGGGSIATSPLVLRVITFQIDTAQSIFDIKEPLEVPYEFREIVPWVVGGILLVLLILGIIYLTRRLLQKEPILPAPKPKPVEPAHVIALRELQLLKEEKLWQTDRIKPFYTRLTDVLRVYIEGRYGVPAMEETSHDIIREMKAHLSERDGAMRNLVQILQTADLVKFAKSKPLPNENDLCMMNAILFVEQTRPVEVTSLEEKRKDEEMTKNDKNNSKTSEA